MADDLPPGFRVVAQPNAPGGDLPPGFRVVQAPEDVRDASGVPGGVLAAGSVPAASSDDGVLKDLGLSALSGLPRGLIETIMTPVTISRMAEDAGGYLYDKGESDVRSLLGYDQLTAAQKQERDAKARSLDPGAAISDTIYGAQDTVRAVMGKTLHKPTTLPGEVAGTIAEFATPGGIPSRAARMAPTVGRAAQRYVEDVVGNVVGPAVLSEGAGKATEGTPLEGPARLVGAAAGNVGTAGVRAANAPEAVVRRATSNMTEADWARAIGLQDNRTGIRLTGPEAISQATEGASALPNVQRLVEGSSPGRAQTGPFFAARPGQVDTAVGNVLDQIAPQSPQPSVLGPRASDAATKAVRSVEMARTDAVDPLYRAANTDIVPADQVQALLDEISGMTAADKTGVLSGPLNDLRSRLVATPAKAGIPSTRTPVTGPNGQITRYETTPAVDPVPEVPITDIENLDRTRKYFRDRMDLPQIGQDAITKEQNASLTSILTRLDAAMEAASSNFAAGKAQYANMSRNVVQPVAEGPVGRVAAANTTQEAGNAILPQNPLTGSAGEAADATARLIAQDAPTTRGLVRQNLGDRYTKASTTTQEGDRTFAGAKFHKDVAGNATRDAVLEAVMSAIGPQPAAGMADLLPVLQATGRRKPIGSATEFNRMDAAELGAASPRATVLDLLGSLGTSYFTKFGDATKRAMMRGNLGTLAELFTDPHSVELIRNAVNRGVRINLGEAAGRTAGEAGTTLLDPRGGR